MENDHKEIVKCVVCDREQSAFFCEKNNFDLYRCGSCGHIFVYPLSAYDVSALYDADYFSGTEKGSGYVDYDKDKEPMRSVFMEYLKKIEYRCFKEKNLLDVGAATGFFVGIAQDRGWKARGLEISEYATGLAKRKSLDVVCGTLEDGVFPEKTFSVITLWDVLEHFRDPDREIRICSKLLGVGGILAINTPDSGSWYARIMGERWHLLVPPEHLHYFTQQSMRIFLERNNFVLEEITKIGKTFTLEYILHTVAEWRKSSFLRKAVRFLKKYPRVGGFAIPINLRDNMVVVARKK